MTHFNNIVISYSHFVLLSCEKLKMSTHSVVKYTDFDVEDSTKSQLETTEVQLAADLVKLSEGYQDPSQVIDGGVDPGASKRCSSENIDS